LPSVGESSSLENKFDHQYRVDFSDELETLAPFISRFSQLKSVRIEFPHTKNMTEKSVIKLYGALSKCSFIKSFESVEIDIPERSIRCAEAFFICIAKLKWLESFKSYSALMQGAIQSEFDPRLFKHIKTSKITNLELSFSQSGEWGHLEIERDSDLENLQQWFEKYIKLNRMKMRIIKFTHIN